MTSFRCQVYNVTKITWTNNVRIRFNIAFTFLGEDKQLRGFTLDGCTAYINNDGELLWEAPKSKTRAGINYSNVFPTPQTFQDVRNALLREPGIISILERDYRGRLAKKLLEYDPNLPTGFDVYTHGPEQDTLDASRQLLGPPSDAIRKVLETSGAFQSSGRHEPGNDTDGLRDILREEK